MPGHRHHKRSFRKKLNTLSSSCWRAVTLIAPYSALLFLLWYILAISRHLHVDLMLIATCSSLLFLSLALHRPKSILWFLPLGIILFNKLDHWLVWPSVKPAIILSGVAVSATICRRIHTRQDDPPAFNVYAVFAGLALLCAAILSIQGVMRWNAPAAMHDMLFSLFQAPLLDEDNLFVTFHYVFKWGLAVALYWVVRGRIRTWRDVHILLWSVVIAAVIASMFGMYSYKKHIYMVGQYEYENRINATCSSPAVLADILTIAVITSAYLFVSNKKWLYRGIVSICVLTILIALVLTGCRTNIIILFLAAVLCGVFYIYKKKRLLLAGGGIGAVIVLAVCLWGAFYISPASVKSYVKRTTQEIPVMRRFELWIKSVQSGNRSGENFLIGRRDHWQCGWHMLKGAPLWGAGMGMFEQEYDTYRRNTDLFNRARTHNVPLRIMAENGGITALLIVLFVSITLWRMARAMKENNVYSRLLRWLFIIFIMCGTSALFSDVFYVDTEAVFVFALYCAIAQWAYRKCDIPPYEYESRSAQLWRKLERRMQRLFRRNGWERFESTSLRRVSIVLACIVLFFLYCAGVYESYKLCRRRLTKGHITYGLSRVIIGGMRHSGIYSMGTEAFMPFKVTEPLLRMRYRAAHSRLLPRNMRLTVQMNGVPVLQLPLDTLTLKTIMWDVSTLQGEYVEFSYHVDNAYVPLDEGWFVDNNAYGAVISPLVQLNHSPTNYAHFNGGDWHVQFSETPEWYSEQGNIRKVYK